MARFSIFSTWLSPLLFLSGLHGRCALWAVERSTREGFYRVYQCIQPLGRDIRIALGDSDGQGRVQLCVLGQRYPMAVERMCESPRQAMRDKGGEGTAYLLQ